MREYWVVCRTVGDLTLYLYVNHGFFGWSSRVRNRWSRGAAEYKARVYGGDAMLHKVYEEDVEYAV